MGRSVYVPFSRDLGYDSRPAKLLEHLALDGGMYEFRYHGALDPLSNYRHASRLQLMSPRKPAGQIDLILTPIALFANMHRAIWVDIYDDWRIAPDLSRQARLMARMGMRRLRRDRGSAIVTYNSPYLGRQIAPRSGTLVPNGVDLNLASWTLGGDESKRVLVLGNFFDGRTDWQGLNGLASLDRTIDVVIVGDQALLSRRMTPEMLGRSRLFDKMPLHEVVQRFVGPRTTLLVPHLLSDYSVSQDLMKVYQFLALGVPCVVPMGLVPAGVSDDDILTYGLGAPSATVVEASFQARYRSYVVSGRQAFTESSSWQARAEQIRGLIGEYL